MVRKFERGSVRADRENVCCQTLGFQFSDGLRVDGLSFRRHVLRDEFFALDKDFAQRSGVSVRTGFL